MKKYNSKRSKKSYFKHGTLYYLSPKHMNEEIATYGYHITGQRAVAIYLLVVAVMSGVGYLFGLHLPNIICLAIAGILGTPLIILYAYRKKYEQLKFAEVNIYIEQVLREFKNSPVILTTLQAVQKLFEEGQMKDAIDAAVNHIVYANYSSRNIQEEALQIIEQRYDCYRLKQVHRFMLKAEEIGGDQKESINILLKDRKQWKERIEKFSVKVKDSSTSSYISIAMCIIICLICTSILSTGGLDGIKSLALYQWSTTAVLILFFFIYLKINKTAIIDLLKRSRKKSDEKIIEEYKHIISYNSGEEMRKGIIKAAIPSALVVVFFILHLKIASIICFVMALYFLCDKQLGHKMDVKEIAQEIQREYPQWLMEMALLLQTDNVQVSIKKTQNSVPASIRTAVDQLIEELEEHPESKEPYQKFLGQFRTTEIQTSMTALYAISIGSGGDIQDQINDIVDTISDMTDSAEAVENDIKMAGFSTLFLLPMIPSSMKLLVDALLIGWQFMTSFN